MRLTCNCLTCVDKLRHWPCGLMDKALLFGSKDCRFESCQGHFSITNNTITIMTITKSIGAPSRARTCDLEVNSLTL